MSISSCQGIEFAFYYKVDMLTSDLSRVFALVSYDMDINQLCHLSHEDELFTQSITCELS